MKYFGRNKNQDEKLSRLFERGVALTLAVSMLLPTVAYGASGSATPTPPPAKVKQDSEFPNIEIQTNFVRSEYGVLDGTMELALRVGPSVNKGDLYDHDNDPDTDPVVADEAVAVSFRDLSVNLAYARDLYTPISWSWTGGVTTPADLNLNTDEFYSVDIPAKKNDLQPTPVTGAIAKCGVVPTDPDDPSVPGLVYFKAEAYNADLTLEKMTTLAVIRFKINDTLAPPCISIAPTGTGDYAVSVTKDDGTAVVVTNVDELHAALDRDLTTLPAALTFASDSDIYDKRSPVHMALHYTGANNQQFYYVPGCNVKDKPDNPSSSVTNVWVEQLEIDLPGPKTLNNRVLAVDSDPNATEKYSYLSNHFDEREGHHHITWPVVSQVSFACQEVDLDNYTTVVYVDWDNTLLGTQILPKGADVREMVNKYVSDRFIYHNADNSENLVPETKTEVSSLTRADSYRGKYPTTPQPLGANGETTDPNNTVRLDGENYPLTNKLDYVFFKRPMEYDEDSKKWKQKSDNGGNAIWDAKYPFAYGWAKCTVDNYEDTWTTLGMGELSDYNGSNNGGYRKLDSGVLASFSYDSDLYDFEMMDFETGFESTDNTVFLKAIYEPGEELLDATQPYRLTKEPYYNKLNEGSSAAGAAYQVDVVFERSNVFSGDSKVYGVARMRQPAARQDITVDQKWTSLPSKGVTNDDMTNPNDNTAYVTKGETAYTQLDATNTEIIKFTISLSARQNKLDYYLMETYNSNFVGGTPRTQTDNVRTDGPLTADNYNYYAEGVDNSYWYAPNKYSERAGTKGFVLYGTLNSIMEKATQFNRGEISNSRFEQFVSMANLLDANLKYKNGVNISVLNVAEVYEAIKQAAEDAEAAHDAGDNQWWDVDHDHASLTYHQLQKYIITHTSGGHGTLLTDTAEASYQSDIGWCNLHTACADQRANKPDTWAKVIAAAREAGAPKFDDFLTLAELESIVQLRQDGTGSHFGSLQDLINAIVAAVGALDTATGDSTTIWSWDQVQTQILGDSDANDCQYAKEHYWWYDGANSVTFDNWATLLGHADAAMATPTTSRTTPDEKPISNRPAKLNQFEATFDANLAAEVTNTNLSGTDPNWVQATENLVKSVAADDTTTDKFDDFDSFKTALLDGLKAAYDSGETSPDWYQIQYMILNPMASFPVKNGETGAPTDYEGYWWHNGGVNIKITDLRTMLQAASLNASVWTDFDYDDMQALAGVSDFRSAFDGSAYTDTDFANFKTRVESFLSSNPTWASASDSDLWDRVQYTLIHGSYNIDEMYTERSYYWWKNGGTPTPVSVSTMDGTSPSLDADALAEILVEAAFRAKYNGNTAAYGNIDASVLEQGRLVDEINNTAEGAAYPADFTPATLSVVQSAAEALITGMSLSDYMDFMTQTGLAGNWSGVWAQIQSSLLTASGSSYTDEYWWKEKDSLGADPSATWNELVGKIESFLVNDGTVSEADLQSYFTVEMAEALGMTPDGGSTFGDYAITDFMDLPWSFIQGKYTTLTWYQVQCMLILHCCEGVEWTDSLLSPEDAEDYVLNTYLIVPPSWLPTGGSLLAMRAPSKLMMATAPNEPATATVTGEDGTETTTQSLTEVDKETGYIITTTVTTIVTPQKNGALVVETTTVNTLDPATGKAWVEVLDTVVAFVPKEETEEPTASSPDDPYVLEPDTIVIDGVEMNETEMTSSDSGNAAATFPVNGEGFEDTRDGEETSQAEHTQNSGSGTLPEVVDPDEVGGTEEENSDETGMTSSVGGETADTFPVNGEGSEGVTSSDSGETADTYYINKISEEDSGGEDPPPIVSTLASRQTRSYRTSIRWLKSPPWLRSPNIPPVTTKTVFDQPLVQQFILTYGRTPK